MLIKELFTTKKTVLSFEFFPPKTERGWEELFGTIASLTPLNPAFVSVTYGAGGTTRANTHKLVTRIHQETDLTVVAHLTCVGAKKDEIRQILAQYLESGITNIMALRGDPPKGQQEWTANGGDFPYASDLIAFMKQHFPQLGIGVAGFPEGHPQTPNRLLEIERLKAKVDAGADYIVTQLFFDNRDFYDFCERCEFAGIRVPILAGIMPISTWKGMARMADLAAGARFPAPLLRAAERVKDNDDQVEQIGIHWATEQIRDLIDHQTPGVHLYTLNKSKASLEICRTLGITNAQNLS